MAEIITTDEVKDFLSTIQGKEITLHRLREEFQILRGSKSFDYIRTIVARLVDQKIIKPIGKKEGIFKVITQVEPVPIFTVQRERKEPFKLMFPRDYGTFMEMDIANHIVIREGDLVLISGLSNFGKTTLCLNFLAENIAEHPVLMGNEYTTIDCEPMPRFLNRLDAMDWVQWTNGTNEEPFTLLPVRDDYAEHIIKDRINIIDWINIESGEHFMIGTILEGIKKQLGSGIAIVALQKAEGATAGRGGQFTKDFADCELLIDRCGDNQTLLTVGKVKESLSPIMGKAYAYSIEQGVKIKNFRAVKKCPVCWGKNPKCNECLGTGYLDV